MKKELTDSQDTTPGVEVSDNDIHIRMNCLDWAIKSSNHGFAEDIVHKAKIFEAYITGKKA